MTIAVVLLVCLGVRRELAAALSVGDCVALASVPVTWTAVRHARRFSLLLMLSILAAGTAYIMSLLAESSFVVEAWARRVTTLRVAVVFPGCPELDRSRATVSRADNSASAIRWARSGSVRRCRSWSSASWRTGADWCRSSPCWD